MTANLMETVKGTLTSEAVAQAAHHTGESHEGMLKAMEGAIPTLFAGLAHGTSTPDGAARIFGAMMEPDVEPHRLMSTIFGDRGSAVGAVLAKSSGVKSESGSHALALVLPLVVGAIGKHLVSQRLTAGGLSQLLFGHKAAILDDPSTPPGLAGALGVGSLAALGGASVNVVEPHVGGPPMPARAPVAPDLPREPERVRTRSRWALALPAVGAAALLVWGASTLNRRQARNLGVAEPQGTNEVPTVPAPEVPTVPAVAAPAPAPAAGGPLVLPGGKSLDVAPDSAEAQLARVLGDATMPLPRTVAPEALTFERDRTAVTPGAATTIDQMAAILGAYPTARIQVVGHADSSGTAAGNQSLSDARAHAIKQALVAKGIGADRIETAGEGARHPAPGTEPTNATNRRAEIVLLRR